MIVIAHRGASGQRPENTLPAFERAIELGADMIEIDLHRSRDGAGVVTHDADLAGLGGAGPVGEATLREIRSLDAGEGCRVPTLEEVLDRFAARIPFNLEIKLGPAGPYPGFEAEILERLRARDLVGRVVFSCFDDGVLTTLRSLSSEAKLALLLSPRRPGDFVRRALAVGAGAVNPWAGMVTRELVRAARAEGMRVFPFTVDDPGEMRRLAALGVDGMFTNHPERLRALFPEPPEPVGG